MQNGLFCALQRLDRSVNQMLTCLGQHLNGHVIRNMTTIDEFPQEIEICFRRRGEANLNLFKAHRNKGFEHPHLAD